MVLIQEPDSAQAAVHMRELALLRRQVLWTSDARDARDLMARHQLAAAVLRLDEQVTLTLDSIRWMRRFRPQTAVLALISASLPAARHLALDAGAWSCMDLPVDAEALAARVLRLLQDPASLQVAIRLRPGPLPSALPAHRDAQPRAPDKPERGHKLRDPALHTGPRTAP